MRGDLRAANRQHQQTPDPRVAAYCVESAVHVAVADSGQSDKTAMRSTDPPAKRPRRACTDPDYVEKQKAAQAAASAEVLQCLTPNKLRVTDPGPKLYTKMHAAEFGAQTPRHAWPSTG